MKRFIKEVLLFLISVGIAISGIDYFISNKLTQSLILNKGISSLPRVLQKTINHQISNNSIIVLGSSRAQVHIVPQIMKDSFNMDCYNYGFPGGGDFRRMDSLINFILAQLTPQKIIINLDLFTFTAWEDDYYLKPYFFPFYKKGGCFLNYLEKIPLYRYIHFLNEDKLKTVTLQPDRWKNVEETINKGYLLMPNPKDSFEYLSRNNTPIVNLFKNFTKDNMWEVDSLKFKWLSKIDSICTQKKIELIWFYAPLDYHFLKNQLLVKTTQFKMQQYFNFLNTNNTHFIEFSFDTIFNNQNLYYDALHLNTTGAEILTRKMAHYIKTYNNSANKN